MGRRRWAQVIRSPVASVRGADPQALVFPWSAIDNLHTCMYCQFRNTNLSFHIMEVTNF